MSIYFREFFIFYIFIFYTYSFFLIDEEFIVFLVMSCLIFLFLILGLKHISLFFFDFIEISASNFFFLQDKKNMFLAIYKDQYVDLIKIHEFLNEFFYVLEKNINKDLNNKILYFYNYNNLYFLELLNYIKNMFKVNFILFYLSLFLSFNNLLNIIFFEKNILFKNIFNNFYGLKNKIEFKNNEIQETKIKNLTLELNKLNIFLEKNQVTKFLNVFFLEQNNNVDESFILEKIDVIEIFSKFFLKEKAFEMFKEMNSLTLEFNSFSLNNKLNKTI
jgi:hypothetical protein